MNLESLWDDVWTTLGLHFQHLILTPSIYVGVWLDICVSQMARLVWIVLAPP